MSYVNDAKKIKSDNETFMYAQTIQSSQIQNIYSKSLLINAFSPTMDSASNWIVANAVFIIPVLFILQPQTYFK